MNGRKNQSSGFPAPTPRSLMIAEMVLYGLKEECESGQGTESQARSSWRRIQFFDRPPIHSILKMS
jgi:hypothetical protein